MIPKSRSPPELFIHGVAFVGPVELHVRDELCRVTHGQGGVGGAAGGP